MVGKRPQSHARRTNPSDETNSALASASEIGITCRFQAISKRKLGCQWKVRESWDLIRSAPFSMHSSSIANQVMRVFFIEKNSAALEWRAVRVNMEGCIIRFWLRKPIETEAKSAGGVPHGPGCPGFSSALGSPPSNASRNFNANSLDTKRSLIRAERRTRGGGAGGMFGI